MKTGDNVMRLAATLLIASLLGGCNTMNGPKRTLGVDGPLRQDAKTGLPSLFLESEKASFADQKDPASAAAMLDSGFALVYDNCSDFFSSAGETQKWIMVTRDAVGAIGTLGTSVLALHNGSKNAVANWALATGLAFSGLDLYTKNFLFSAENVDAVRTLVSNALIAHQQTVLSLAPFTYQTATVHLLDNQNICTPAAILALVRTAIKKGQIATMPVDSGGTGLQRAADNAVLQDLGTLLNPPGPITQNQAGALWWLLRESSTDDQKRNLIAPMLAGLPPASQPFDNGKYRTDWAFAARVGQALDKLSAETKNAFRSAVAASSAAPASRAPATAAAPPKGMPEFSLGPIQKANRPARVAVDIR